MVKDTVIDVSFNTAGNQIPYMMIIKEYYIDGKIEHAEVIYKEETKQSNFTITS
jgi:hypothetical protein